MKVIFKNENMMIIHSVKNILEMNDIDCHLKNEHGHTMGAEFGLGNTLLELCLANDNDYERASEIIQKEIIDSENLEKWHCAACDEENDGNFAICWSCQVERPED